MNCLWRQRFMYVGAAWACLLCVDSTARAVPPVVYVRSNEIEYEKPSFGPPGTTGDSLPSVRRTAEFGTLKFPYCENQCGVLVIRAGGKIEEVGFLDLTASFVEQGARASAADGGLTPLVTIHIPKTGALYMSVCFTCEADSEAPAWKEQVGASSELRSADDPRHVQIEVHGQPIRGSLQVCPVRDEKGHWLPPTQVVGEYLVVDDPSQRFVYDRIEQQRAKSASGGYVLFGSARLLSNAGVDELDDGRLALSLPAQAGVENPRAASLPGGTGGSSSSPVAVPSAPSAPGISFPAPQRTGRLVFGRVVEVRKRYGPWILSDAGLFDTTLQECTAAIEDGAGSPESYLRRGNIRHQLGDFVKALEDYQKGGGRLTVQVVAESASLKAGKAPRGTARQGDWLAITHVNGKWLWGELLNGTGESVSGWIDRKYVR